MESMRIKPPQKFVAVVADTPAAGEVRHRLPRSRQKDRRIADQKHNAHHQKEFQKSFLPDDPARDWDSLESVVISYGDRQHHRWNILRGEHRAEGGGRGPIERLWTAL